MFARRCWEVWMWAAASKGTARAASRFSTMISDAVNRGLLLWPKMTSMLAQKRLAVPFPFSQPQMMVDLRS